MKTLLQYIAFLFIASMMLFSDNISSRLIAQVDEDITRAPVQMGEDYSSENTQSTQYTVQSGDQSKFLEVWISLNPQYITEKNLTFYKIMWQRMSNVRFAKEINGQDFGKHTDAFCLIKWDAFSVVSGKPYIYRVFRSISPTETGISTANSSFLYEGTDPFFYVPATVLKNPGGNYFWVEIITPSGELHIQSGFIQI